MAGFVQGVDREQVTLFPARLDEYVAEDNPVRAVDAWAWFHPGSTAGLFSNSYAFLRLSARPAVSKQVPVSIPAHPSSPNFSHEPAKRLILLEPAQ
jgi:hypothetical protein